jgi:hypothetical protein
MKSLIASMAFAVPFLLTGIASAADAPSNTNDPDVAQRHETVPFKHLTLTANPLSLLIGRVGVNVEYLPVPHHAIVANPFYWSASDTTSIGDTSIKDTYSSFGGELGYHFYTGSKGANGFYAGPSLILMTTSTSTDAKIGSSTVSTSNSVFAYGGAFDIGGQHVFDGGFTIGGGAGVMALNSATSSTSNGTSSSTFKVSGVLPRVLFTIGYSF